jgi:hypothetical protein
MTFCGDSNFSAYPNCLEYDDPILKGLGMILDLNQLEVSTDFQFDICIIGAGATGIAIARALKQLKIKCDFV